MVFINWLGGACARETFLRLFGTMGSFFRRCLYDLIFGKAGLDIKNDFLRYDIKMAGMIMGSWIVASRFS